jgi:hypothetical protein
MALAGAEDTSGDCGEDHVVTTYRLIPIVFPRIWIFTVELLASIDTCPLKAMAARLTNVKALIAATVKSFLKGMENLLGKMGQIT